MNICYINPTDNMRRPIAELATLLSKQGHSITILYPKSHGEHTKNWRANKLIENNPNIKTIPIDSTYIPSLRYSFPKFQQLNKAIKKIYQENDIIHIWEYYYPLSVRALLHASFNKARKNKTILTTDGFVGYSYKPKEPWWLVPGFKLYSQLIARFLFKIPHKLTTYGHAMVPFGKQVGFSGKKLHVLPTGIHASRLGNASEETLQKLKQEFNITNEKIILYVGMLTERKGIKTVIDVGQRLLEEKEKIKVLLVGDAHGQNTFKQLVPEQFRDKIILTGGRTDFADFMQLATLLILPSEGEGLPGVVMEAMATGIPVVATNEGCTPDLIEKGKEGILVEMYDTEGYYNATKTILHSTQQWNGKEKIKQFTWDRVAALYKNLYQNTIDTA